MSHFRQTMTDPRSQGGRAVSDSVARSLGGSASLPPSARALSTLADVVSDALFLVDAGARIIYLNDRAVALFGSTVGSGANAYEALSRLSEYDSAPEVANGRLLDLWRRAYAGDSVVLGTSGKGELAVRIVALTSASAKAALAAVIVSEIRGAQALPPAGSPAQVAFADALSAMLRHFQDAVEALAHSGQVRDVSATKAIDRLRDDSGFLGRAATTLSSLLRLTTGETPPETTSVDLSDVLMATMPQWKPRAPRHSFELALAGETPPVPAIEPLVTLALDGLLEAATLWTPDGGVIRVTVRSSDDGASVTVRPYSTGQYLGPRSNDAVPRSTVSEAQPPEVRPRAEVGLALARAVLEAHGGRLNTEPASASGLVTIRADWIGDGLVPVKITTAANPAAFGNQMLQGALDRGGRKVLLVWYPDGRMLRYLRANLESRGFDVVSAGAPSELASLVEREEPDAILVDVEGVTLQTKRLVDELRSLTEAPVLMLASEYNSDQCVDLLNAGAADYIGKPFNMEELIARLHAAQRSRVPTGAERTASRIVRTGDLSVDLAQRIVTVGGSEVRLSRTEFKLLRVLAQHIGTVLAHDMLLERVWGAGYTQESDFVWVYVRRLRRKIEPDPSHPCYVVTVPGVGYRLARLDVPIHGAKEL